MIVFVSIDGRVKIERNGVYKFYWGIIVGECENDVVIVIYLWCVN